MRRVLGLSASGLPVVIAVFLTSCNSVSQVSPSSSVSLVEPTPVISHRPNLLPRELKLKLTLDDPADLKVKQGDRIQKGQVLSDRSSARTQLEQQRQVIRLKLEHLHSGAGVGSRSVSYAVERARVRQAQVRVQQAREAITQFKINSPWTDYALASLPLYKESTQVSQLEMKVREAETEMDLAVAQLQAAREKKPASQDTSLQQVLLMSQLKDVEARLDGVGMVRSPYHGTIKKIKWIAQADRALTVELVIVVAAS
ncbi:MAG: efflux RND transporter periplasmic adaptor subunit [Acaryochloris sp. CRU_2_0]|nr:efflux RND transporter periplasmic adaptor subunit [Acaryochloris sp. CRU_2_0]